MKKTVIKTQPVENPQENAGDKAALYHDIVNAAGILIWRTDAAGRFTFLNPVWEETYGHKIEDMLGRPFSDFQSPGVAEYYINEFRNCLIGEPVTAHETVFFSKSGDEIHLILNMAPLHDGKGKITGTQGVACDVTERRRADDLLQYISAKDELTGLYNLHTFLSMTEQQVKTALREKKKMLIIYAGADNMQAINEEYGHDAGNRALIDTANIFRKTFREADVLARTGGDEFAISTLVFSKNTEEMIMARLQENIDAYNSDKSGALQLSLSFGASFSDPEKPVPISELLSKAEAKMYGQKKGKKR